MRIIIFLMMMFVSFNSFSATNCKAIQGDQVVDFSGEVCVEDKSFLIFYDTFPSLFNDYYFKVVPNSPLKQIVNEDRGDHLQKTANEAMISGVFKVMVQMSHVVALFFFLYSSFFRLLKGASRGDFMLDTGVSGKTIIFLTIFSCLLLIPIGDIALVHILILIFIMLGIAMANTVYGYFIADIQQDNYMDIIENQSTIQESKDILLTHNGQVGLRYASSLTKMALCREITTQYIMDSKQFNLDADNYKEKKECAAGKIAVGVENVRMEAMSISSNLDPMPTFINHQLSAVDKSLSKTIVATNEVIFGVNKAKQCPQQEQYFYTCGRIATHAPSLIDYPIVDIIGRDFFMSTVHATLSEIPLNGGAADRIERGWTTIYKMLLSTLEQEYTEDKEGTIKYDIAKRILADRDMKEIKAVSYIYHQYILNGMTSGLIVHGYNTKNSADLVSQGKVASEGIFVKPIIDDFNTVNKIAKKIQHQNCLYNASSISKQDVYKDKSQGKTTAAGSAACVDIDSLENYSLHGGEPADIRKQAVMEKIIKLQDEAVSDIKEYARSITKRKIDVEDSFNRSIKDLDSGVAFANLRREGWLMLPYYNYILTRDVKMNESYIRSLVGSNTFENIKAQFTYIADDLYDDVGSSHKFYSFTGSTNVFSQLPISTNSGYYTDNYQKALGLLEDNQEEILKGKNFLEIFSDALFYNPIRGLKDATGLSNNGGELTDKDHSNMNDCLKDMNRCMIPKQDPLTSLQGYGQQLLAQGMVFLSVMAAAKSMSFQKDLNSSEWRKEHEQNQSREAKSFHNASSKTASVLGKFFSSISQFMGMLSSIMMLIILCGIFLTYILPLLPVMFFTIAFLSYFLICFQVLMLSPILAANLVRIGEEKDKIVNALKVYILSIIFKPVLLVVAYICMYGLFKVAFFFVNITLVKFITSMDTNNVMSITAMFKSVLFIAIYVSAVIFVLTFIMKGFNSLTNIMLKAVGAGEYENDVSAVSDTLKGALAVWGAEKATGAVQNISSEPAKKAFDSFSNLSQKIDKRVLAKQEKEKEKEKELKPDQEVGKDKVKDKVKDKDKEKEKGQ